MFKYCSAKCQFYVDGAIKIYKLDFWKYHSQMKMSYCQNHAFETKKYGIFIHKEYQFIDRYEISIKFQRWKWPDLTKTEIVK